MAKMSKRSKSHSEKVSRGEPKNIDEALEFYGGFLDFTLRSRSDTAAIIDLGDQFMNFSLGRKQQADDARHFGLVVDDKEAVRVALERMGVELVSERFLDFLDPWGNRVEIVAYENIQFTKSPDILRGMKLDGLDKNENARRELAEKGMA